MIMSLAQAKIKADVIPRIKSVYAETVFRRLERTDGCLYASLIRSVTHDDQFMTLSFWKAQDDLNAFTHSAEYDAMMDELNEILAESTEWQIQLTTDLTLQYAPVPEKPIITSYNVATAMDGAVGSIVEPMVVRVVSMEIDPVRTEEFKRLYREKVIEKLKTVKGCLAAYLSENHLTPNAFISVTLWDCRQDADAYERGGVFAELVDALRPTFSGLANLQMQMDKSRKAVTSEDLRVERYEVVSSKSITHP
jgi:quinol monooxygenase YgiN